jgi:DEAD/DEAH box helicase domain-containing protein
MAASPTSPAAQESAADTVERLLGPSIVHIAEHPPRCGSTQPWPDWVEPEVRARLRERGVTALWSHQRTAAEHAWNGRDVVLATGTASGKSLAYQLVAMTWARTSAPPRRRRSTLYLAPTKALAADQWASLDALQVPHVRSAVVDGDSTREERTWAARHADVVLTNPDMLHRSLLPGHRRWAEMWSGLRLVVVDESHYYRGLFGSHVAWVLRRVQRVAKMYGAAPAVMLLSATMADPGSTARRLVGRPVHVVDVDDSPSAASRLYLVDTTRDSDSPAARQTRRSRQEQAGELLAALSGAGHQTICFVRSRRAAETVAADAASRLRRQGQDGVEVAAYRGGYLPDERRSIEQALRAGDLAGVAATNALELGVDIAGMDAVLIAGWPGTRTAFWQQSGRAGRSGRPGVTVLLAGADPLETYVVRHPSTLVGAPLERSVIDPANPYVAAPQLCAAAAETPWTPQEVADLPADAAVVLGELTEAGALRRRTDGWYWPRADRPSDRTDIRGGVGSAVRLVEVDTGRLLGTVDGGRAPSAAHPGAVYVHRGASYLVTDLDLADEVAMLVRAEPDYDTWAQSVTDVRIVSRAVSEAWGEAEVALGTVDVTSTVTGYQKRHRDSGDVIGEVGLDMPEQRLRTSAVWWTLPDDLVEAAGVSPRQRAGAAHAAEHASIGLLPLFATCDRWDIGGVSTPLHPDTGRLTVVVHDGQPGGAGFSARGFEAARPWLAATRDAIEECPCQDGCPACVQSPKCGSGNSPLHKVGAVRLLTTLLTAGR